MSRLKVISFFGAPSLPSCRNGRTDVVKYLCEEMKCNVDCTDHGGETPLHEACR